MSFITQQQEQRVGVRGGSLSHREFPDRNSLIVFLVESCGWPQRKVAGMFEITDRQIRRILQASRDRPRVEPPPERLTGAEIKAMLQDYALDHYTTAEERELARQWITSYQRSDGVSLVGAG